MREPAMEQGGRRFPLWGGPRVPATPAVVAHREHIVAAGRSRNYLLVTAAASPAGAAGALPSVAAAPAAVLVVLHGSNQTGQSVRKFSGHSFDVLAADGHVAVVYPDGLKKLWNHDRAGAQAADDVAFMGALVDHFHRLHGPVPVIMAGFSNGGQLVIRLIHEIPHKLHGAAIVGATLPRPGGLVFADRELPLPVLLMHGTRDPVVPYRGEGWFGGLFGHKRGPSAPETAAYFAARNGITAPPVHTVLPHRPESGKTHVTLTRYEQGGLAPVALHTVVGGGHVVPNAHSRAIFVLGRTTRDISAVAALKEFFPVLLPQPPN